MKKPVQIFAVGGGGFTHQSEKYRHDAILEDYLLTLTNPIEKIRIGYIGHASNDDQVKTDAFHKRFEACASTAALTLDANLFIAQDFLRELDILYVGGGSTTAMLAHWQKTGIAEALIAAAHQGLILSGVSAGAICWFSELLLGTEEAGYALHKGLGLLAGSACPHFSTEPPRKCAFKQQIADGNLANGLAIDDGVAIHVCDGIVTNIIRARQDGKNAYIIRKDENKADVQPLNLGHKVI